MRIRAVRAADAPSIVELLNPLIEAGSFTVMAERVTVEDQLAFQRAFPEGGTLLAAVGEPGGELLGIQDVVPIAPGSPALAHVGEVSTFVARHVHRQGIGGRLCRATFERCRGLGFRKLLATIRADNPGALAFYERQGFRVIGVAREHARVGDVYLDEVLAEKLLDATDRG